MDLFAMVAVELDGDIGSAAERVGRALGLSFRPDQSGRYEEYPAYVGEVLGVEVALLGPPLAEQRCTDDEMSGFQLMLRTFVEAPDDEVDADLSAHIVHVLRANGVACHVPLPEGDGAREEP